MTFVINTSADIVFNLKLQWLDRDWCFRMAEKWWWNVDLSCYSSWLKAPDLMALHIIQTLLDLHSFNFKEAEMGKKWNSNITEVVAKFFFVGKDYETKVVEENCQAITWAVGWSCCHWSGFRALEFGFQLDCLVYAYMFDHMCIELWSAQNLSEHRHNCCASWGVSVTMFISSVMLFIVCWVTVLFVIQCTVIGVYWKQGH